MRGGSQEEALKRALRFLSYRARSEAEVRSKLARSGFPQRVIEATLSRLRSLKLVNDETFARSWAQTRAENRGYGPLRIKRELGQKGISQSLIGRVLQETFNQEEEKQRARKLLERRFRGEDLSDLKILRRAVDFLRRRGYRDSVIGEVVKQPLGD